MMLELLSQERKHYATRTMETETIHKRIQRLRKAKGWTQQDLALRVSSREGLDKPLLRQTVTQWEDGSSAPHRDRLAIVAAVLGVSVEELLGGPAPATDPVASEQQLPLLERRRSVATAAVLPVKGEIRDREGHPTLGLFAQPYASVEFSTKDRDGYALRVSTDLLAPRYRMGEIIVLEPSFAAKPGDDVLVRCKGGRVLVRILAWERDDVVQLVSPETATMTAIAMAEIEVLHAIVGHVRPGAMKPALAA